MLGVDAGVIESDGAVSQAVAEQMADRARALSSVEAALGVTGIAGPGGGTAEKPVGTVWIAWSIAGHELISRCFRFDGDRQAVRQQTVLKALEELLLLLDRP
jgi:nicotinamide-nucleotide amidase